ncbi:MAG: Pepco domain-containing protein [Limnothrix sp. BL-A-16]
MTPDRPENLSSSSEDIVSLVLLVDEPIAPAANLTTADPEPGRKGVISDFMGNLSYFPDEQQETQNRQIRDQIDQTINRVSTKVVDVSARQLAQQIKLFETLMQRAIAQADLQTLEIEKVQLQLGISAEGSIGIQAVGAKGGMTGTIAIELKLKG